LIAAVIANIVAIPVSGSRTLLILVAFVVSCGLLALLSAGRSTVRLIKIGAAVFMAALLCLLLPVFRDSLASFEERWSSAQASEGEGAEGSAQNTFRTRVLDQLLLPFEMLVDVPLLGHGIGLGSNVAAAQKTGEQGFLLAEAEWPRIIQECGPIFGLLFLGYRVLLCAALSNAAFRLPRRSAILSFLLVAATAPQLLTNAIEQPTNQGFMVFGAGLCLASAKRWKIFPSSVKLAPSAERVPASRAYAHPANARP
jgi:hypothetical protein